MQGPGTISLEEHYLELARRQVHHAGLVRALSQIAGSIRAVPIEMTLDEIARAAEAAVERHGDIKKR